MEDEVSVVSFYVSAHSSQKIIFSVFSFVSFHQQTKSVRSLPRNSLDQSLLPRNETRTDNYLLPPYLKVFFLCVPYIYELVLQMLMLLLGLSTVSILDTTKR